MKKLFLLALLLPLASIAQTDYSFVYDNEQFLKSGMALYDEGKYEEARKEYAKISPSDPKYINAQYETAMALSALDKKDELRTMFEDLYARKQFGNLYSLYTLYGSFLSDEKEFDKSEAIFNEGASYLESSSSFNFNRAILYIRKEQKQKAVDYLEKTIVLNPNFASAHYLIGLMALEDGRITEGTLALLSYLAIAPTGKYANEAITKLNLKFGQNYLDKGTIVFSKSGDNFEEIETILRNQLPLKSAYKVQSSFDDIIIRQVQAVAEYSLEHKMDNGFFETNYIPWVRDMMQKKQFEGFSYYMLMSLEDKLGKKLTSQKKKIVGFAENYIGGDFWKAFATRKTDHFGKEEEVVVSIKDSRPFLVGQVVDGKKEGRYKLLDEQGNISGELNFVGNEATGLQKYYDGKGNITAEKNFKNNTLNGTKTEYYTNGLISTVENYTNDVLNGISTSYYVNGGKHCEVNFVDGERDGKLVCLYPNGRKESEGIYNKGKRTGPVTQYNEVGDLTEAYNYVDGLLDGKYMEYYDGKKVKAEGMYSKGKVVGSFKRYYASGVLSEENIFTDGKISRVISYSAVGKKTYESTYTDKEELDTYTYFDNDEKKFFVENYKSGELRSAQQFLNSSPKPIEISLSKKPFTMKNLDGSLRLTGNFEKGKKVGNWKYFYKNGRVRLDETYEKGNQVGISRTYNHDGTLYSVNYYQNDTINGVNERFENGKLERVYSYKKGDRTGPYKVFYPDGSLSVAGYLIDNQVNYTKNSYWQNGQISRKDTYIDDYLTAAESFNSEGNLEKTFNYKNSTGQQVTPFYNGTVIRTENRVNGVLEGKNAEIDKEKTPISDGMFVNGQRHYLYKGYSPYGTILLERNFYNGQVHGLEKSYDAVGNLKIEEEYLFGDENGKCTRYYHTKGKLAQYNQVDGAIEGDYTLYNQKGEAVLIMGYTSGEMKYYIRMSKSGELNDKVDIQQQSADIKSFYPNGKLAVTIKLDKGGFDGDFIISNAEGKPEYKVTYANDMLTGDRIEYYSNGNIFKKEHFVDGNTEGPQEYFKEDGKPWLSMNYKNDELHGDTKIYANGKLVETKKYDSDELIQITRG